MKTSAIAALTLLGCLFGCSPAEDTKLQTSEKDGRRTHSSRLIPEVKPAVVRRQKPRREEDNRPVHLDDVDLRRLSENDAKLCVAVRTALDEEDVNGVLVAVGGVTTNSDAAVRQQAVEALAWFGEDLRALEKLQTFIDDPDEEVAADAFRRMDENTDLIQDETERNNFLLRSFYRRPDNEQVIDFVCDKLKDADHNEATMKTIVKLAVSGEPLAMARAKEAYKFITGDTYISSDKAMEWIKENGE